MLIWLGLFRSVLAHKIRGSVGVADEILAAIRHNGSVLIADRFNNRVLRVSSGRDRVEVFAGAPDDPTQIQLNSPVGVAVLVDGLVLIADTYNCRVVLVNTDDSPLVHGAYGTHKAELSGSGEESTSVTS